MEALCFCVVHPSFCPSMLLSSAIGISCTSQQYWNLREVITATNRLNDYSFGESGTGLGSRIRQKIWIHVGQCFAAMSNRCWHLVYECTNFTAHSKVDVILHTISHSFKDFTYRFHINMYEAIFFHFWTTGTDTFMRPFVHCTFLLAMATLIWKHFQRISDKCSSGGIIWPLSSL